MVEALEKSGFEVVYGAGAGYKILLVVLHRVHRHQTAQPRHSPQRLYQLGVRQTARPGHHHGEHVDSDLCRGEGAELLLQPRVVTSHGHLETVVTTHLQSKQ